MDKTFTHRSFSFSEFRRLTICVLSVLLLFTKISFAQLTVTEAGSNAAGVALIEDVFLGSCVSVSNVTYLSSYNQAVGEFNNGGTTNIGLNDGIIMTTGRANLAIGPNNTKCAERQNGGPTDADLAAIAGANIRDRTVLEFDFIPQNDTLTFRYVFASEEYHEWVNAGYNDAFGFFISGPGIAGPYLNGAINIARIPATVTPVTIDNVNNGFAGPTNCGSAPVAAGGPCTNCAYFVDNLNGITIQYDAFTSVLTATAVVTPCETYHIKLAVGDAGDQRYDSGVFLEGGSFSAGGGVTVELETTTIPPGIYEGCNDAWFIFRRVSGSSNAFPITANFDVTGTAIPGVDYSALPSSVTIPAGQDSVLINISVFLDFVTEGPETITVTLDDPPCACETPGSATVTILDNDIPLAVSTGGTTTICLGQSANLTADPTGSQTPYTASWNNGAPAGNNVTVSPTNTTTYTYTVTDNCGGQQVTSSETITVIRPDFTVDDDEQCFDGNSFNFTNTGATGGSVTHLWNFGDSNTSNQENPTHSFAAAGDYTVTHYIIFTASSCTASASAVITVFPEPEITATVDQNVICAGGTDGVISTSVTGGTANFTYLWSPGGQTTPSISGQGIGTYTVTVTDANGCTDSDSETIIQVDPVDPNAVCQNITVQLNGAGNATISANDVNNGSSDNCGIASMVVSPNAFTCANLGANTVTLTVTDVNGNTDDCTATVTVEDNVDPNAVCQNITVQLNASGNVSIVAADVDGGSTDNCSVTVSATPLAFTCANVGANNVALTATDGSGNTDNCVAVVTVEDNVDPTALCQDVTLSLNAGGTYIVLPGDIDNGSNDACGIAGMFANPAAFDCSDIGVNAVTLTVTDNNGNISTCTSQVTIVDDEDPTAVCQNITVQLDGSGNATITAASIDNGSDDNCSVVLSATPLSFTCANVGANNVTLTATDPSGNTDDCVAVVTIEDNIDPTAICQNITVQLDGSGNASIVAADVDNGSNDNCSVVLSATPLSFTCANVGTNNVTLTATDPSGNTDDCVAVVTIEDNIDPTAICQNITVQLDGSGNVSIVAADVDNGSNDNCSVVLLATPLSFTCANVGANNVTLTATDPSGNTDDCVAIVTVEDDIDPTAICQNITVQLDGSGNASIVAADIDGGSTDNCSGFTITPSPNTFTCADLGVNTVTLTVTDANGNVSTCTADVTVEDNVDPTAVCQNITVQLDASGNASIVAADVDGGSSDNCSVTVSATPLSFTCANLGSNNVTLTATDPSGNTDDCTATVTVEDNVDPTAICQNITVQLDGSGNASIVAADVDNGSSDNCSVTLSATPLSFNCSNLGANTVTLTATDPSANTDDCTATVNVEDNVDPTAICQNITVQLDATGNATIVAADVDGGSSDNCSMTISATPLAFTCANVGANSVTLTATDGSGSTDDCVATVTVEDNIDPTAVCQNITVQLDANGDLTILSADIDGGSTDNCGIATLTIDGGNTSQDFDCSNVGANTVTLTVTDVNGNVSTCDATVTVEDNMDPTAICQNITVQLDGTGNLSITSADIDNGSSDACGIATLTIDGGNISQDFDCSDVGSTTVTLTVTDVNGNVSTCDATVTIEDNVDPSAVCQNITVQLDANGDASISTVDIDNGSSDNCGVATITLDGGAASLDFDCSDVGVQTVTLTVTDVNGNVSTCTADVTIEDTVDPTALCQNITIQLDANGDASISTVDIDNGSSDNCGIATITLDGGAASLDFDCSDVGVQTVTLTVTDVNGNVSTCTADVTIEDTVDPTALCQNITTQLDANGDASISTVDIDNGSSDNCGIATITLDGGVTTLDFDCSDVGVNTVTLTVTDVQGNVSTCTADVTVEDNIDPTAVCQNITVQLDANGDLTILSTDIDGGSTDNCGIASITIDGGNTSQDFDCTDVGANTVTLTVTDVNGNVSTCDATVTVEDNVDPTAICQNITVQLDGTGNLSITSADIDNGSSDACGIATLTIDGGNLSQDFDCSDVGSTSVTLTVTDVNGNVSTCDATVTIEDNVDPTAVCQNITVQLDANGELTILSADIDGGSTDNCGIASLEIDGGNTTQDFDCSTLGTNTVTLTVTDLNGNVSTCDATVTVEDNVDPVTVCQNITVQLDANGEATISGVDLDGGTTDNCSASIDMTLTPDVSDFDCSNVGVNTITLTVTDANGNISTCSADVTVEDSVDPTAICQDITVQLDATGSLTILSADIDGGSTDACGIASLTIDGGNTSQDFDCSNVGANTVTLTVTDVNGNVSTCDATVTIEDVIDPTAVCQNITVQLDANGDATVSTVDIDNGSSDNCGIATITLDGGVANLGFDCSDVGVQTVTLTVTDVNGNVSTCSADVTLEDNVDPSAVCQNITVQLDAAGNATITGADIDNGSADNCGVASLDVSVGSFDCTNVGVNTVTLTVTDNNGNVSTCTADVTIEDNVDPTAVCQNITVQLDANGDVTIVAADVDGGSTDNCGIDNLAINDASFDCNDLGNNLVTLTVTDVNGNSSTCTANVTVQDLVPPTPVCQDIIAELSPAGTVTVAPGDVDNGSFDNCAILSITLNPNSFTCAEVGFNTVTLTVTDISGNVATCTAQVDVQDNVLPTAFCQDITVQLDGSGNATITPIMVNNGSSDACGAVTPTIVTPSTFDCSNVGVNIVTLTVEDQNGNISTCASTVTIEDIVDPIAVCQDITVQLDGTGNVSITPADVDGGSSDNCAIDFMTVSLNSFTCAEEGANTVTLTVTDVNGNVSTCTAMVTVENNVIPTVSCQDITIYLDAAGNASIVAADVDGGSNAACGIASLTVDLSTFDCSNVGANTVTLMGTDNSGNVSTCTATVTVVDDIDPTAICQDVTVQLDASGNASVVAATVNNGSTDNCAIAALVLSQTAFDCAEVGANTVTLTVTDVNGNVSTCTATITVEDNIDPIIVCQNITVELDATGNISITGADIDNGTSDNCSTVGSTLTFDVTPGDFDCNDVGTVTVTLTATDENGNSSSCTADVTVQDNEAPIALCQNITVYLDAAGNVGITPAGIDNGSSDNCAIDNMVVSPNSFTCSGVGTNPVTLTVFDVNGNVASCISTVTVIDTISPTAICQDITVQVDASGNASIVPSQVNNGSSDACGVASLVVDVSTFNCSVVGANTVELTVTDNNGNVSTCSSTVTVEDNVDPNAVCQNVTVQLDANGDASIIAADIENGSTDNCAIASYDVTPNTFDCSNVGANTVTLTVTDVNGNTDNCTATVTVQDNIDPTAVCQNITVQLDANGELTITSADIDNGSSDNCGIASLEIDGGNTSQDFDCSNVGTNSVTLTVTDVNGNVSTCNATITVEDNIDPIIVCQNITVELDATGNISITGADIDGGSTDNCGIASLEIDGGNTTQDFDCSQVGTNTVTLTVTDVNGNVSTCDATVTVEDNVDPTAVCQDITVQLDANGELTITSADIDGGSSDNCGIASLEIDGGNTTQDFDCSQVGTNTVTLTVTDVNGNVSTCDATVTVEDNIDPTAVCQDITVQLDANGELTITSADIDGGSTDNCGIATLTIDGGNTSQDFDCSNVGANTVTLTVTDVNGNVSTCDATVTVEDNMDPTAICQNITVQLDGTGNLSITSADIDNGSSDACGIATLTIDGGNLSQDFDCSDVGSTSVTLTVTDVNGNVSTCDATVTIEDNVDPTAVCQNITVQLDANGELTILSADIDGGSSDNCAIASLTIDGGNTSQDFDCSDVGANTVTFTVTDVNGNVSTCDATVTIEDNVDPTAVCQNVTVQLDANGDASISTVDIDNGSTDNCGIATITLDGGAASLDFDCSDVGVQTVTLTVTDVNGNVSTCTADVTIEDTVDPTALCQNITIQLDANGDASISTIDIDNGSTDNCGIATITLDGGAASLDFDCSDVGVNTVTLTVTDVNGNVSTCDATVTVEDIIDPTAVCQNITVQLDANGELTILSADIDGGSTDNCGIASLEIDGGNTSQDFDCSNVGTNTVVLTVEDNNGNTSSCSAVVTIVDNVPPTANCLDLTVILDGNGTVNVSAGELNDSSFDNCAIDTLFITQYDFTCADLGENIITLTVVDVNGNSDDCASVVTVLDTLSPVIIGCPMDTVIVPDSSDCTPQVFWTEPTATDNCTVTLTSDFVPGDNFPVGTTTVTYTATDQSNNSVSCSFNVTISPSPVLVSIVATEGPCGYNLSCNGAADGEATANVSGGCLPYQYDWTNGQTTQTATGLGVGLHAVTVTDANGTSVVQTVTLTQPDVLATDSLTSPEFVGGANVSCDGATDGSVNINLIGGSECVTYAFAWTGPNGFVSTDEDLTGLEAGTYVVTVTDASGCFYTDSITLTAPDTLSVMATVSDYNGSNISCGGAADGWIDLSISGGAAPYSVVWNIGDLTEDIDSLMAGIYSYTVTDANGCVATGSVTLTEPDGLSSFITTSDYNGFNISCNGLADGSIDLTVNEGTQPYSYLWNNGEVTEDLDSLEAGTYIVNVTDANGCTLQDSVTLIQPDPLVVFPVDTNPVSCNGVLDGSFFVQASGGVPTYTFAWSDGQMGPTAEEIGPGIYVVTVTDLNACQDSLMLLMTEPNLLEASIVSVADVICFGESNGFVDVNVIGGTQPYSYDWSNASPDQDLNGIPAGTYSLEVTDANGCSDTLSVVVNEPTELTMAVDTVINSTCSGASDGSITVLASGGTPPYVYFWPALNQSGPTVSGLNAGTYEVQVQDANSCIWSMNVVVGQPTSISAQVSVQTHVTCNGLDNGSALVTVAGGTAPYSYLWSNSTTDSLATGFGAGVHTVNVTDAAGCDTTLTFIINEPSALVISWDTIYNVTCNGLTNGQIQVDVDGGVIPYNVSWSNGNSGYVANNLGAGTHTVYVTDGNGCTDSLSTTISEPSAIQLLQQLTTNVLCKGGDDGQATVIVEGGTAPFTYNWPGIGQTGNTATGLEAGTYTFVAADANGCLYTDTIVITEPDAIAVTISSDTAVCPGSGVTISASASGGAGNYSYSWDNGLGFGPSHFVSPLVATTYSVEVFDQSGCASGAVSVTVSMATTPVAAFSSSASTPCVLPTDIQFTNMSSGATGYQWLLGNGTTSMEENPTATYSSSGTFTVTLIATSGAGCADTTSGTVLIDNVPTVGFSLSNAQGCAPLVVGFNNSSSTGLDYLWDFGDGTTSNIFNPIHVYDIPGEYTVNLIVTSAGGCVDTLSLEAGVSAYPSPIADFTPNQISFPEPGNEYEFVNNSVGADLYNWDFGNGVQTDEFQPIYDFPSYGGYFVTLTAINEFGCADTAVHYLSVELFTSLHVPNAMGIGELGEASIFLPKGTGIADYHLWIFDNWGNLLWESTALINGGPAEGWNGNYKGQFVPQGSYLWKINATFVDGEIWEGQENSKGKVANTGTIMVIF